MVSLIYVSTDPRVYDPRSVGLVGNTANTGTNKGCAAWRGNLSWLVGDELSAPLPPRGVYMRRAHAKLKLANHHGGAIQFRVCGPSCTNPRPSLCSFHS